MNAPAMKYLVLALLLITSRSEAQTFDHGKTVAEVYASIAPKVSVIDTVFYDRNDPEGNPIIRNVRFAPFHMNGVDGILIAMFDPKGRIKKYEWYHDVSNVGVYFLIGDPRRGVLDSLEHRKANRAQFDAVSQAFATKFGKPRFEQGTTLIANEFKKKATVALIEGSLQAVWPAN